MNPPEPLTSKTLVADLRELPEKLRRTPVHLGTHISLLQLAADEIERQQRENATLAAELAKWITEAQREKDRRNATPSKELLQHGTSTMERARGFIGNHTYSTKAHSIIASMNAWIEAGQSVAAHEPEAHQHTDECWEPDSGCDMGRSEKHARLAQRTPAAHVPAAQALADKFAAELEARTAQQPCADAEKLLRAYDACGLEDEALCDRKGDTPLKTLNEMGKRFDAARAAVLAAMRPAQPSNAATWQPIETAPSGVSLLCYWPAIRCNDVAYEAHVSQAWKRFGLWFKTRDGRGAATNEVNEPTHWMPLPTPPTKNSVQS